MDRAAQGTGIDAAGSVVRLLITGSREWRDDERLEAIVGGTIINMVEGPSVPPEQRVTVVHGDCPNGADALTRAYCERVGLIQERHPADWSIGRHAGFLRNEEMVELGADLCLAFLTPGCKGTVHCAAYAQAHNIRVVAHFEAPPLRRRR